MPELPEVEVTRLALAPYVEGGTVRTLVVRERRLRWPVPTQLAREVQGQPVLRLERRGKYLLWRFARGTLISHQGMSGVWRVLEHSSLQYPPARHDHVDVVMTGNVTLRYSDPRRFGALLWHGAQEGDEGDVMDHPLLRGLGIEPFDPRFDSAHLFAGTRGRKVAIKQLLLAGHVVVGVGNIYASEALFHAGISPRRAAQRVTRVQCERLAQAVRTVLAQAIALGGSTLRDFVGVEGEQGYFMLDAAVYGRAGLPCKVCATPVRRILQGQRASYFCPRCQH